MKNPTEIMNERDFEIVFITKPWRQHEKTLPKNNTGNFSTANSSTRERKFSSGKINLF